MATTIAPDILKEEGLSLFQQGMHDKALAKFQEAAAAYKEQENETGRAEMLNNIGVIYRLRRQREDALSTLAEAEAIFAEIGDKNRQAQALGNLGDIHTANKHREEAARCYSDSAELFAQTGDRMRQSQILRALSLLRLRQGGWMAAMMHMEESLRIRPHSGLLQKLFRALLRFALSLFGAGSR